MGLGTSSNRIKVIYLNTNLLSKFTFVNNFVVRVLNAFVKPCSMEQGGARLNEFAEYYAGSLCRSICFALVSSSKNLESGVFCCRLQIHESVVKTFHKIFSLFQSENL